ncbi:thioredoxin family protein [Candidatus Parcubacteria bacterium]|nr:thioredoxin family protein [Candidatus Parcubacteria bacterium]
MNDFFKGTNKNLIALAIAVIGILVIASVAYTNGFFENNQNQNENVLSADEVSEKVINFINENLLEGGIIASLIDISEESNLYKIKLKIGEEEFDSYISKDGKLLFPQVIDMEENLSQGENQEEKLTIGNFSVSENEICKENEKPIVYFFSSKGCPHCTWEHPIIEKVAKNFDGHIAFHNNMDSDADMGVFQQYSSGGVPTLVIGCKYYRVGSGESMGEEGESNILTALICKLTQNQPAHICEEVQDLINQVK